MRKPATLSPCIQTRHQKKIGEESKVGPTLATLTYSLGFIPLRRISKIGQLVETNFFLGDSCFHYNQKDLEWLNSKRVSLPMLRRWWCHWAWCGGLLQAPRFRSSFSLQKAKLETLIFSTTVVWLATTGWNEMCILPWDFTDRCHSILLHKSQCL